MACRFCSLVESLFRNCRETCATGSYFASMSRISCRGNFRHESKWWQRSINFLPMSLMGNVWHDQWSEWCRSLFFFCFFFYSFLYFSFSYSLFSFENLKNIHTRIRARKKKTNKFYLSTVAGNWWIYFVHWYQRPKNRENMNAKITSAKNYLLIGVSFPLLNLIWIFSPFYSIF